MFLSLEVLIAALALCFEYLLWLVLPMTLHCFLLLVFIGKFRWVVNDSARVGVPLIICFEIYYLWVGCCMITTSLEAAFLVMLLLFCLFYCLLTRYIYYISGYCYLSSFPVLTRLLAGAILGPFPEFERLYFWAFCLFADWRNKQIVRKGPVLHMQDGPYYCETKMGRVGSTTVRSMASLTAGVAPQLPNSNWNAQDYEDFGRSMAMRAQQIPTTNQIRGQLNRFVNPLALELTRPRLPRMPRIRAHRQIVGDHEAAQGHGLKRKLGGVSAMESAKCLLSGSEVLGAMETRMDMAVDTFIEGIPTSVAPSDPNFTTLVQTLGPMQYSPRIEAHPEAATFRRAALDNAIHTLQGAIVGLVSPSNAELHAFPRAAVWEYTDALDCARRSKHCTLCRAPRCGFLISAGNTGRLLSSNDWRAAASFFRRFEVSSLLLINIEPNLHAIDLTKLMVEAEVYNALSLATVDWRVIMGRSVTDSLIGMTTELSYGKVVSSFKDGGDYVQSLAAVKQMFSPTFALGHSLRRTLIFGKGATQFYDLTLARSGWATRCVPDHGHHYFIRLVLPDMSRPVVLVERKAFDRVLATYRTQAIKEPEIARIVLRQSVVTYSISGTQVTPRMVLSATESEALATWMVVYSEVQDRMNVMHVDQLRPDTVTQATKKALYGAVASRLSATPAGGMALGTASSIDALLRAYRTDIGEMTLDQLSQRAMTEHFGEKIDPISLQNGLISTWGSLCGWLRTPTKWLDKLTVAFKESWSITFGYVDVFAIAGLIGVRYTLDTLRVFSDCAMVVARITGKQEAVKKIAGFLDYLDWPQQKATRFWVSMQSSQNLDFQAATIDIVETFFNTFGVDHAADIQRAREMDLLPAELTQALQDEAALPYSDFLSEIKLFLGKFNSHVQRAAICANLLNAFHHDCRHASQDQKDKMIHLLKQEINVVKVDIRREMAFALTGKAPECRPIPLKPIAYKDVRGAYDIGHIEIPSGNGPIRINKLNQIDGKYDFSPIHRLMDLQHTDEVNPANVKGPNYISPDERGSRIQLALINHVANAGAGVQLCPQQKMMPWYTYQLANPSIKYVEDVIRNSAKLFSEPNARNWIAHITGLAYGGKSKGLRDFISSADLVVVPTKELKLEWLENLGKLDPVMRATVVTQHEALITKYASRYVMIDECYAYDPEHLQAICNRHVRSKGVITIGDKRQISNVFYPQELGEFSLPVREVPCIMVTPTTFMPWDAAVVFINSTTTDAPIDNYFVGSAVKEGLIYTLGGNDVLLPGEGDIAMQGTQAGKEMTKARGVNCATVHECQGRRAQYAIIHTAGRTLTGDMNWLAAPEQKAHMGVSISRAGRGTIFVVDGLEALRKFPWYDDAAVNGTLSDTAMYGGTAWDFVEPRCESESTWEHIVDIRLVEPGLTERPLTDPTTIATVFTKDGEPISASEIRTNIELVGQISFRDEGIANSDQFDHYTIQPRDIPGADQVQALTRSVAQVDPTPEDFQNAEVIVEWLFDEVIDKKKFFAHVNNSRRAAIHRQTRNQVIDGCYANYETAASTLSFAFLKPEFAKKPSILQNGPSELKAQGVVSASDLQQALFADVCDALTHAWARSMQPGKLSPVGLCEQEVEDFLATMTTTVELDIEKQDASHKWVHIIVASIFIELCADKMGLGKIAMEIRKERRVRMMNTAFKFVLNMALASGDPWTLIINKIMAWSSLVSVAHMKGVQTCQSGDDVTMGSVPQWRDGSIKSQHMANKGLTWKMEERDQRKEGVTFISRAVLPHNTVVYKALRTILKYAYRKRNSIQHAGIQADVKRIEALASRHGLQAYAEARAQVWGGDPVVIFDMWVKAIHVANMPFDALPTTLKSEEPRMYTIQQRNGGCFGYALAKCVRGNVQAVNAIAKYPAAVTITTALEACRANRVPCIIFNEKWAVRSKHRLITEMDRRHISRSFVVIYEDHAVAVVPNTITIHSSLGKRTITWKSSMSKDVEITDFE